MGSLFLGLFAACLFFSSSLSLFHFLILVGVVFRLRFRFLHNFVRMLLRHTLFFVSLLLLMVFLLRVGFVHRLLSMLFLVLLFCFMLLAMLLCALCLLAVSFCRFGFGFLSLMLLVFEFSDLGIFLGQ